MIGLLMIPCVLVVQLKETVKLNYKPLSGKNVYFSFLLCFVVLFLKKLRKGSGYKYRCGYCGEKLHDKGICPHCGAINE